MPKIPLLPYWCLPLVWLLVVTLLLLALAFILFYGIMFGDYRARLWLTSLFFSFLSSILLLTPLKVGLRFVFLKSLSISELKRKSSLLIIEGGVGGRFSESTLSQ